MDVLVNIASVGVAHQGYDVDASRSGGTDFEKPAGYNSIFIRLMEGVYRICLHVRVRWNRYFRVPVAYPGVLFGEGVLINSVEDSENGGLGATAPPSQGFWRQLQFGTRNFISHSNIFLIFGTLRLFMMTTNLFVIANVKQLRTGGSFTILLPFFRTSWPPEFSSF